MTINNRFMEGDDCQVRDSRIINRCTDANAWVKVRSIMSKTFERIEPISKKTRVVTMLRQAILSGAITGGEQIVEAKLAQELGVGQGLVREALIELEHHGFVERTPFTGTSVTT